MNPESGVSKVAPSGAIRRNCASTRIVGNSGFCGMPSLGVHCGVAAFIPLLDEKQQQKALSLGRAVRMSATLAPWNANYQAQAIATRILFSLFSMPYSIHYGLAKDPMSKLKAHALVCAGHRWRRL